MRLSKVLIEMKRLLATSIQFVAREAFQFIFFFGKWKFSGVGSF